jgi:hypothetical protein
MIIDRVEPLLGMAHCVPTSAGRDSRIAPRTTAGHPCRAPACRHQAAGCRSDDLSTRWPVRAPS